ncbi:MAG: SprT family zinc-dependent metalloprotease [Flavobacteriales bacterium]|nr:SprT family zinc-dependent metalloprotease [Flavobacteriales bacterium]
MIDKEVQNVLKNKYTNCDVKKQKLMEVLFLCQQLLEKFDIKHCEVSLLNHSEVSGRCYNNGERISLQVNFSIDRDIEQIQNIILHEIAHALVGVEQGHNLIWKQKALEIGVKF